MSTFPYLRNRRLRASRAIRSLVDETRLSIDDFLCPIFLIEGQNEKQAIGSMPNYFRYSLDTAKDELKILQDMGVKALMPFAKALDESKDNAGTEALNDDGLMQRFIRMAKETCPELLIFSDVALDPYSSFGHDGIVKNGKIVNDETCDVLAKMAVSHAKAGADFIAPSDMMDGRVAAIREELDDEGFEEVGIMAYSAKYASCFYGPFRDALDSAPVDEKDVPKDKKTYQMNPGNSIEALREIEMDIDEGADIVMVKPAMAYLDIIYQAKQDFNTPVSAYQVSGEYAMLKASAANGWIDHDAAVMESLTSIKRAGASMIASYFIKDFVRITQ
ncbi:MAG: porphobilinogen synthase [Bacteroidota bacterium]